MPHSENRIFVQTKLLLLDWIWVNCFILDVVDDDRWRSDGRKNVPKSDKQFYTFCLCQISNLFISNERIDKLASKWILNHILLWFCKSPKQTNRIYSNKYRQSARKLMLNENWLMWNGWPWNERSKEMQDIVAKFNAEREGMPKCLWQDENTSRNGEGYSVSVINRLHYEQQFWWWKMRL